jgi:hypothetical protein
MSIVLHAPSRSWPGGLAQDLLAALAATLPGIDGDGWFVPRTRVRPTGLIALLPEPDVDAG